MKTVLSKPQVEFLHSQILALGALLKEPGEFDAKQSLQRARAILSVLKLTVETALEKEDMANYLFSSFD